jgi:hypothetical protein
MPRKRDGKITERANVIELWLKSMKVAPTKVTKTIVRIMATPPRYGTAFT